MPVMSLVKLSIPALILLVAACGQTSTVSRNTTDNTDAGRVAFEDRGEFFSGPRYGHR
jgi:hypothetical protein